MVFIYFVLIIISISIIVLTIKYGFKKPRCPVCEKEIENIELSNARFNEERICQRCIDIINFERGGEKPGTVFLNDLQDIVNNYNKKVVKPKCFCEEVKRNYGVLLKDFEILDPETQLTILLENKYSEILTQHYLFLEQENMLYSTAINLPSIKNDITEKCINICKKDIDLADAIKQYNIESAKISKTEVTIPRYPAFYYLTQLYDRLGLIDEAIKICQMAIELGYFRDNSKGGMPARLARLLKKQKKNEQKINN